MSVTRTGEITSGQISVLYPIQNLAAANFGISGKNGFLIKNDDTEHITLEVTLIGMPDGEYTSTVFPALGYGYEIVKEIKANAVIGAYDLKYAY